MTPTIQTTTDAQKIADAKRELRQWASVWHEQATEALARHESGFTPKAPAGLVVRPQGTLSPGLTADHPVIRRALGLARAVGVTVKLTDDFESLGGGPGTWGMVRLNGAEGNRTMWLRPFERFPSAERAASTILHELIHWAGFPMQLNRPINNLWGVGIEDRALEEATAQTGAWLLMDQLGIDSSASNIHDWHTHYLAINASQAFLGIARPAEEYVDSFFGDVFRDAHQAVDYLLTLNSTETRQEAA